MNILDLINKKQWNKILKNKKFSINKSIHNGNFLVHYIVLSNDINMFNKICDPKYCLDLCVVDNDKNTVAHLACNLGYHELLKEIIKNKPSLLNKTNNDENTVFNMLWNNYKLLKYFLNKYKKHINSIDNVNNKGETVLSINTKNNNIDTILLLAKFGANLNWPKENIPIIIATENNNLKIVKLLKENGANINSKDKTFTTPFIISVIKKNKDIVEYLLKNNVDHSYIGGESDDHPVVISLFNQDIPVLKLLLNNNINLNQQSRYLNLPAHFLFMNLEKKSYQKIPLNIRKKILLKTTNINKKNINGYTVLHYLMKNDNWRKYKSVLKDKKIDLSVKNDDDKKPLDYLKNDVDKQEFIDFIYNNYVNLLKKDKNWLHAFDYKCSRTLRKNEIDKFNMNCKNKIIKKIKESNSFPKIEEEEQQISVLFYKYSNYSTFSTTAVYNVIYALIILQKYSNLTIPFVYNPLIRDNLGFVKTDSIKSIYNIYKKKISSSVVDIVNIYSRIMIELSNFLIIWYDKNVNFIPQDFKEAVLISSDRPNIRFIFIRVSIIVTTNMNHANVLIYDLENKTIERFDPYGVVPYGNPDDMDDFLEKYFINNISKDIKYIRPKDYMDNVSFQIVSNEHNELNKKFGDPGGYCLAWVYWYIEMRVMNKNVKPKILVDKLINIINSSEFSFIEYIRNYANNLDKEKTIFFAKSGIDEKSWYNTVFTIQDISMILNQLRKEFDLLFY